MIKRVRLGVLGSAKIGTTRVIPAMQRPELCEVVAIASRCSATAARVAAELNLPKAYGSYEELLADPDIDAIYNPLPNHLHVPWSIKALENGKHVLCEKPIGLSSADARKLVAASERFPHLKVMEAFMYRFHPQWIQAKRWVDEGAVGKLRTIQSFFSYFNDDATNIRNQSDIGGGALLDIGCYCISLARFLFGSEPAEVSGMVEFDPDLKIDRLASAMLQFETGTATFTCSTQLQPYQRVSIFGTHGCVEIEIPFNAPPDKPCKLWLIQGDERTDVACEVTDQYTIQGDLFAQAILDDTPVPTPLIDAVRNMEVIERIFDPK